jgi:transposase-like protein
MTKKKYKLVSNEKRAQLVRLIHMFGLNISKASNILGIFYPTAKAINRVYMREHRVDKKSQRAKRRPPPLESAKPTQNPTELPV